MFEGKKVSVVMPAFNESAGIYETVKGFLENPLVDEVVVADNNSTDDTAEKARRAGARVVSEKKQGYGYACRKAMSSAEGDLIVLTEADNSFFPEDLKILFAYIPYFDMVKGARSNRCLIQEGADWTFGLMLGNYLVAKYMQMLYLGLRFMDNINQREVGGTYRVIKKEAFQKILPYITEGKSAFLPDMTTIALRKKLKVIELPVRYRRRLGISKITGNRWRAALLALRMIFIITKNRFKKLK